MEGVTALLIPAILALAGSLALCRGQPVYTLLQAGIREGLQTVLQIFPPVAATLTAVYLFRESGAFAALTELLAPLLDRLGIPRPLCGLLLLRPFSGSAALAAGSALMEQYGPDSLVGRTAAVLLGSTETSFYVLSVYFGAAGVRNSRHALPAALLGEAAGMLAAVWLAARL